MRFADAILFLAISAATGAAAQPSDCGQFVLDLREPDPLVIVTNRFNDESLLPERRDQLIRKYKHEGFMSLTGSANLIRIWRKNSAQRLRFFVSQNSTLEVWDGRISGVHLQTDGVVLEVTRGKESRLIFLTDRTVYMIYHPQGSLAQLLGD